MRENDALLGRLRPLCSQISVGTWSANFWNNSEIMKTKSQQNRTNAFTILELLIIIFHVVVVTGLLLPCFAPRPRRAARITCVSNLKQIGLALRLWSGDHHEKFPMMLSTNQAGSLEWSEIGQAFRHFQAISNELNSPKVLACAADKQRTPATTFAALTNKNLSY